MSHAIFFALAALGQSSQNAIMKYFLAVLLTLLFSCGTQQKTTDTLNSWIGNTKQQLIQTWGPPTQTTSDGGTGEVLVFAHRVYYVQYGGRPVDYWEYRMMYADAGGKIYHWIFRRNPNPPERIDVRVLAQ